MRLIGGKNAKKTSSSSTTKRHFTVVIGNKEHGLYVSSSPSSAARKAVSKLCATDKKRKVQFSIREITQGSKKKTYGPYSGYIEKLKEPIELKGRVIKYKPVAKLSGKSSKKSVVKKGVMRGGTIIYECYTKIPGTDYTFKIEKLGTNRDKDNHRTFPFNTNYCLTIINNSNSETTLLESREFLSYLNFNASHDEFIRYLIRKSNEHKTNLSIQFSETSYMTGHDKYIEKFLTICYNFLKNYSIYSKTKIVVEIKDNVDLVRSVFNESGIKRHNPTDSIKVNLESWMGRITIYFFGANSE